MHLLVVGLLKKDSGQSCEKHAVCGSDLREGDLVFFHPINDCKEYRVYKAPYHVGYLKRDVARAYPQHYFSERLAEVVALYGDAEDKESRHLHYAFNGVARIELYPACFSYSLAGRPE